jgi:16S rRNA (cytidine1402-2'-O)-methyltransferase
VPSLYIVATPIGNLEDITFRAIRVLKAARLIAAEDTRTTRKLLTHYEIHTPLTSYHDHNRVQKIPAIISALEDGDVALVSDAGTPGISDPGLELVQATIDMGIPVVSLPGPSAVVTALAASGIPADHFLFLGFLPRKKSEKHRLLQSVSRLSHAIVIFEAPHRLQRTLTDLYAVLGNRPMAVVREATKLYEEVFRGTVSQCLEHFAMPRGEFTLVISGSPKLDAPSPMEAEEILRSLLQQGVSSREAREQTADETGLARRAIYQMWLRLKGDTRD